VKPSDTPASELVGRRGIIISGGPASVYDPESPQVDPGIFQGGSAVLGICYGQQLMAHWLGGSVHKGTKGEYGSAVLDLADADGLFAGWSDREQVWMSHRDTVAEAPQGFSVVASTATCPVAAIADHARKLYGVQFHPEVVHTSKGTALLSNFLFGVCGCEKDWDPRDRVPAIEEEIRQTVGDRNVFFFVSGGVDSTVAFTLCLRALGPKRVHGVYVDTGLMRAGETEFVRRMFDELGAGTVDIEQAAGQFLGALALVVEPESKRHTIGEQFVKVQERIIESEHLLDGNWILGQGTIYPDTIESGGTAKAALIKTHHNRVAGIQKLLDQKRIVEPLSSFYKDEVREIGRELGLPAEFLERHPFPGPGLAIRCLCAGEDAELRVTEGGFVVPVHSVGVQGDSRSYAPVLAVDRFPGVDGALQSEAGEIVNATAEINRVVARVDSSAPLSEMKVFESGLSKERLERLRAADGIVREMSASSGFDAKVWQFPVVLIPLGCGDRPDSVVLRPIDSTDGMTAQSVVMEETLLRAMAERLLGVQGVCGVFYDLTHKPPGTIEWE
jgi:GMP synthase (glutamine-hydrolysing)